MKNIYRYIIAIFLTGLLIAPVQDIVAGNKDRSGQAGAGELLINPWARSSGWGGVNVANSRGLEAVFTNIAGTAFTHGTEIIFSNTTYLKGADVNIMAFGLAQRVGETGALTISIMSMNFGDIEVTNINNPDPSDGSIGTFSPTLMNINIGFGNFDFGYCNSYFIFIVGSISYFVHNSYYDFILVYNSASCSSLYMIFIRYSIKT